jgi:hypothetical protein
MNCRRFFPVCRLLLLPLAAAMLFPLQATGFGDEEGNERPRLTRATMLYGRTPRVPANAWAYLHYGVENATSEPTEVRLVFTPRGQRNITIYDHTFTLEPGFRFRYRMPVTVGTVEDYTLSMYHGPDLLKEEDFPVRLASPYRRIIWFINDNIDLEYGNFSKNENLNARYTNAFTSGASTGRTW